MSVVDEIEPVNAAQGFYEPLPIMKSVDLFVEIGDTDLAIVPLGKIEQFGCFSEVFYRRQINFAVGDKGGARGDRSRQEILMGMANHGLEEEFNGLAEFRCTPKSGEEFMGGGLDFR